MFQFISKTIIDLEEPEERSWSESTAPANRTLHKDRPLESVFHTLVVQSNVILWALKYPKPVERFGMVNIFRLAILVHFQHCYVPMDTLCQMSASLRQNHWNILREKPRTIERGSE